MLCLGHLNSAGSEGSEKLRGRKRSLRRHLIFERAAGQCSTARESTLRFPGDERRVRARGISEHMVPGTWNRRAAVGGARLKSGKQDNGEGNMASGVCLLGRSRPVQRGSSTGTMWWEALPIYSHKLRESAECLALRIKEAPASTSASEVCDDWLG